MSPSIARVAVIIPAAGSGQRLGGGTPKALRLLGGRSLLEHSLHALIANPAVAQVVLAVPAAQREEAAALLPRTRVPVRVVIGGDSRQASVARALEAVDPSCGIILVHDAARPLVPPAVVGRVIDAVAAGSPVVVPGLPVVDTIKRVDARGIVLETPPRHLLRAIQTPQGFLREVLIASHRSAPDTGAATDDAALAEAAGFQVLVVDGDAEAMKITTAEDLRRAEQILAAREGR